MPSVKDIPLLTIVVPVFNDEEYIARALDTAINQSLKNIEIICVDDCSTDDTVRIIQKYTKKDPRVKLIRHKENASAFQARLSGIEASCAEYILFLDGDDELHKDAAKLSYKQAVSTKSDIVGFGSRIVRKDGSSSLDFERSVQPQHKKLLGKYIIKGLFEPNKPAQGQLWRYLFSKQLLLSAYAHFPKDQQVYRSNDLLISFTSIALARKYTSISNKLYTYHFYAGGSGRDNFTIDKFKFYSLSVDTVNLLGKVVDSIGLSGEAKESYYSTRISVISNIIRQIKANMPPRDHSAAIKILLDKVSLDEIAASIATFTPEALDIIREGIPVSQIAKKPKNIAIFTNNLNTGGVQGVVVSQAKYLNDAGFKVVIVLLNNQNVFEIPDGVEVEYVQKGPISVRLRSYSSILKKHAIDVTIDHGILYNFSWPYFSLVSKSINARAIAWIHNFALRPITEGRTNGQFIIDNLNLIDDLVVLSKPDVSYWKAVGHKNVYFLPNPPSPLLLGNKSKQAPKKAPKGKLNIIWLGRLQQATKKVCALIDVASELSKLTSSFTLTIVGPDSEDLTAHQLKDKIKARNLEPVVKVVGPKHGKELIAAIEEAHVYISTSIIEGYPLTITEAQSYALPVVMYELPWLAVTDDNRGIVQVQQNSPELMASEIYKLLSNKASYEKASAASIDASASYLAYDFEKLYRQLIERKLPAKFSPDIDIKHMKMFITWTQFYLVELLGDGSVSKSVPYDQLRKDSEIEALKRSKEMLVGTAITNPMKVIRYIKRKLV